MAGNELKTVQFILENTRKISLNHLGLITEIGAPNSGGGYTILDDIKDLSLVATEDSGKKADIYVNGQGISLKQTGSSFAFNRLQRSELIEVFNQIGLTNPLLKLARLDKEVDDFHNGYILKRSRPWSTLFEETDFKRLVEFLMTKGSPNLGYSEHPANLLLEAPSKYISKENINVYTFDEYFNTYKNNIYVSIRRQWIGQSSDSEHKRAVSISNKEGNRKWVYSEISGEPRVSKKTGKKWRDDVPPKDRRTVYMIFIEKK